MITKATQQYALCSVRFFAKHHSVAGNDFNFPKHKELFAEDYYEADSVPNPYK